jgi:hypothetical protein
MSGLVMVFVKLTNRDALVSDPVDQGYVRRCSGPRRQTPEQPARSRLPQTDDTVGHRRTPRAAGDLRQHQRRTRHTIGSLENNIRTRQVSLPWASVVREVPPSRTKPMH